MEIRFYDQWEKRQQAENNGKIWRENTPTIILIVLSIACAFLFSFLIFAGGDGQAAVNPHAVAKPESLMYTVEKGDTLWGIASKYYPEKSQEEAIRLIQEQNGFQGTTIHAGQSILLP